MQTINDSLDIEVPGSAATFNGLWVSVASFGTPENKQNSLYIIARDIGAAPPGGEIDFAVNGQGYISSPTITVIIQALETLAEAIAGKGASTGAVQPHLETLKKHQKALGAALKATKPPSK
jgi:hypothetical protein